MCRILLHVFLAILWLKIQNILIIRLLGSKIRLSVIDLCLIFLDLFNIITQWEMGWSKIFYDFKSFLLCHDFVFGLGLAWVSKLLLFEDLSVGLVWDLVVIVSWGGVLHLLLQILKRLLIPLLESVEFAVVGRKFQFLHFDVWHWQFWIDAEAQLVFLL